MTDQHPEVVTIQLGGKTRHLKFGMGAFRRAERLGAVITARQLVDPTLGLVPLLVWIGLLKDEPALKEDEVLDWLDEVEDQAALTKTVLAAWRGAQRGGSGGDPKNAPAPGKKARR
jgi:hypothetical protein